MKLFFNQTSPYARKVRVVIAEKSLQPQIEMIDVDPWSDPPELLKASPLSKVPVLITADGISITESDSINRYLDELLPAPEMFPTTASARAETVSRMALLQGMIDAAFDSVIEKRRPAAGQWPDWIARQHRAVERGLATLNVPPDKRFDLGDVSLACLLGYMDFRLPQIGWRGSYPLLAGWYDGAAGRPSMSGSRPD